MYQYRPVNDPRTANDTKKVRNGVDGIYFNNSRWKNGRALGIKAIVKKR